MYPGANEDFVDKTIYEKHQIPMILAEKPSKICLANDNLRAMGPMTHRAKVPIKMEGHQETAILLVTNLQNQEIIVGMP